MSGGGPLQAACVLALLVGLVGCSYSLEQRIEALHASSSSIEPHAPEPPQAERRTRSRTRAESRSLHVGGVGSAGEGRSLHTGSIGAARSEHRNLHAGVRESLGNESRSFHADNIQSGGSQIERWKPVPADHKPTPYQNSSEWVREQAEAAEKDRALDIKIRSICRGC